jgi:hypothetical protein
MQGERIMEIIFQGRHDGGEACESVSSVLKLLQERYHINAFREIHLSITLVDDGGDDVELVDSETNQPYRVLEVCRSEANVARRVGTPGLKLVVDNT